MNFINVKKNANVYGGLIGYYYNIKSILLIILCKYNGHFPNIVFFLFFLLLLNLRFNCYAILVLKVLTFMTDCMFCMSNFNTLNRNCIVVSIKIT